MLQLFRIPQLEYILLKLLNAPLIELFICYQNRTSVSRMITKTPGFNNTTKFASSVQLNAG